MLRIVALATLKKKKVLKGINKRQVGCWRFYCFFCEKLCVFSVFNVTLSNYMKVGILLFGLKGTACLDIFTIPTFERETETLETNYSVHRVMVFLGG